MHWSWMPTTATGSLDLINVAVELVTVVAATFVGALLAFRYETRHRTTQEKAEQVRHGQRALFAMTAQISALENLNLQHLAALRDDLGRDLKLLPIGMGHQIPVCDVASLMFLVDTDPQLLGELLDGQQTVDSLFYTIGERNKYHMELQERLATFERSGGQLSPQVTSQMLEQVAGPNIVRSLSHLTAVVYDGYERARTKVNSNFTALRAALMRRFPKTRFISFELLEPGKIKRGG